MGGIDLAVGALAMGALTAATTLVQSEQGRKQQKAQADTAKAQADIQRKQAELAGQQGRIEAENLDQQKSLLRREFNAGQARNRSLLGAGNVDMASGSALDVSMGNINRFAADVGENAYQKALKEWETDYTVKNLLYEADMYDAQSSYLKKSAGNFGTSLLTAGISGVMAGLGTYAMGGGFAPEKTLGEAAKQTAESSKALNPLATMAN